MTTTPPIVPPPPTAEAAAPEARRWRWEWLAATAAVLIVVGGIVASFTVRLGDWYVLRPGSARELQSKVVVEGDVEVYESEGVVHFTTVTLREATASDVLFGWFDDDVQVVKREEIFGDRSAAENRQLNVALMDTSKQTAFKVALEHLGFEVPITVSGYIVTATEDGFGADGVIEPGETIVAVDGEPIERAEDLTAILSARAPDAVVAVTLERADDDTTRTVDVSLTPSPDDPDRGLLGVQVHPRDPDYGFPFPIDIETANVGGPSAGLAFSLAIIDVLSPGDLTGGLSVAVTGSIDEAGVVGNIGGIAQKVAAVRRRGIDVFLVPADLAAEAESRAGDDLQVIGVATLSEALTALQSLGGTDLALGG